MILFAYSVVTGLVSIVKSSSYVQSLKGVLTAGVGRSTVYAADKVKKMIRSIIGM